MGDKTQMEHEKKLKCELYCDNFQNFKRYNIPKAQLVIADIPYNLGNNAYGSNPMWYVGGITRTGKANWQVRDSSIRISTSILRNTSISAIGY